MERITKRRWLHKFESFESFVQDSNLKCGVCRCSLTKYCEGCQKILVNDMSETQKSTSLKLFMTLLCMKNRKTCVFNKLDYHVVSKIYYYILYPKIDKQQCRIVTLECDHKYHRHCWEQMIRSSQTQCPFDGTVQCIPTHIQTKERFKYWHKLIYVNEVPIESVFVSKKKSSDHARSIECYIIRKLKHRKQGYSMCTLFSKIRKKFKFPNDLMPTRVLKEHCESLIFHGFIKRDMKDPNVLIYNP